MQSAHQIADLYRSVVSSFTPVPTKTQFREKGILTPQEFVEAGDQLVFKFPTWTWEPADAKREVKWLPPNKQYLVTRNVPCKARVKDLDTTLTQGEGHDRDWFLPGEKGGDVGEDVPEIKDLTLEDNAKDADKDKASGPGLVVQENFINENKDDIPDLDSFADVDNLVDEEDPASAAPSSAPAAMDGQGKYFVCAAPDADIVRTRSYDLTVTYDKYYQTPRLWLFGYDENGVPLKPEQIFEDVMTQYATKTVTVDPHPCTGIPTASIHPCRHAQVMKKVVDSWVEQGVAPRHDLALFVFLKFISSIVPTIDYDFTMDIDMAVPSLTAGIGRK